MEATIYNQKGKEAGKMTLPESVFGLSWNGDLVHQVVNSMISNARVPVAHTKGRGDVRGGGKKPWKQKGTGRARHGSTRSPIWIGGGVTHGPSKDKNFEKKINKKMRAKAFYTILSRKLRDGEVLFLDKVKLGEGKTREAKEIMTALSGIKGFEKFSKKQNAAYIAFGNDGEDAVRGFRNFGNVGIGDVRSMSPVDLLNYTYVVITDPQKSVARIAGRMEIATQKPVAEKKAKAVKK